MSDMDWEPACEDTKAAEMRDDAYKHREMYTQEELDAAVAATRADERKRIADNVWRFIKDECPPVSGKGETLVSVDALLTIVEAKP